MRRRNSILPTKITNDRTGQEVAWLCEEEWELPKQLETLEYWLLNEAADIGKGTYSADIGYSPRAGAAGGGGKLSRRAMKAMLSIGMELYFSEYPEFEDD